MCHIRQTDCIKEGTKSSPSVTHDPTQQGQRPPKQEIKKNEIIAQKIIEKKEVINTTERFI